MRENRRGRAIAPALGGFAVGATLGSLIALLFAPAPGRVTRKRLAKQIKYAKRAAGERMGEGMVQARRWITEHVPHGNGRHTVRHRTA